jgi:hypothetical protein
MGQDGPVQWARPNGRGIVSWVAGTVAAKGIVGTGH